MDIKNKNYCIKKRRIKVLNDYMLYKFYKMVRDDASFPSTERPFLILGPLKEKHFLLVFKLSLGSLKSVSAFLKHLEVSWDALVNRLQT